MVPLHAHLNAFADLGRHRLDVAGQLAFRNAIRSHHSDHSVSSSSAASLGRERFHAWTWPNDGFDRAGLDAPENA